ncbi:DUF262 domain-containing protein [Pinirhizobacter soli]|uniref:DUF262 domain-containing protein n=1 Tax=Pinirhizobacter soli TaxID=2786953 RepID=UPI00202A8904|nr:DUF262 domain-containing protein [Pinirhizobacter soli]
MEISSGGVDEQVDDLDEVNEVLPTTFSITSYGADYPVDGLVKRLGADDIVVPLYSRHADDQQETVGFQREFVWSKSQADRFIESLLLGLPVPGVFFVKEATGRHLVLDGQQRLRTLQAFYEGIFQGKEFKLQNVQKQWIGKSYKTLAVDDRRRLDDSIIHATIVRQDEPDDDQSSVYLIFERLNSGGTFLQPQEIRVALYHGKLVELLSALNDNLDWRALYGKKSARLKDIELILRFFAMVFYSNQYRRPMKDFLNRYMAKNRDLQSQDGELLKGVFDATVSAILNGIGQKAFRLTSAVNAAVLDAVMCGVAANLLSSSLCSRETMAVAYLALVKNETFLRATTRATADVDSVRERLDLATKAFSA